MAGVLVEHLTLDTQVKLYRGTVLTVLEKCGEELEVDHQVYYLSAAYSSTHVTIQIYSIP